MLFQFFSLDIHFICDACVNKCDACDDQNIGITLTVLILSLAKVRTSVIGDRLAERSDPMASMESVASFKARAFEIGMADTLVERLTNAGVDTFGRPTFAV